MHDVELAFHCFDRVVLMDKGRIVLDSPAEEVAASPILEDIFDFAFDRVGRGGRRVAVPVF